MSLPDFSRKETRAKRKVAKKKYQKISATGFPEASRSILVAGVFAGEVAVFIGGIYLALKRI